MLAKTKPFTAELTKGEYCLVCDCTPMHINGISGIRSIVHTKR